MFFIKPKPKIKFKKFIKEGKLEMTSLPTELEYKECIDEKDNVTFEAKATIYLNWQKENSFKDRLKKVEFKFTKKF